jgi:hypothetical protein
VADWAGVVAVVAKETNTVSIERVNSVRLTNGAAGVGVGAIGGRGIC